MSYEICFLDETEYEYSGSEDEKEETPEEGEPSSIIQGPGESTLRRNFLKLQANQDKYVPRSFPLCFVLH